MPDDVPVDPVGDPAVTGCFAAERTGKERPRFAGKTRCREGGVGGRFAKIFGRFCHRLLPPPSFRASVVSATLTRSRYLINSRMGNSRHSFPDPSFRLLLGDKKSGIKDGFAPVQWGLPTKVGIDNQLAHALMCLHTKLWRVFWSEHHIIPCWLPLQLLRTILCAPGVQHKI